MGGADAPAPRDLYNETSDTLQAQVDLAPQVYAAEAQYGPKYTAQQLKSINDYLTGTPGGTRNVDTTQNVRGFRNTLTGEFIAGNSPPAWTPQAVNGRIVPGQTSPWQPYTQQQSVTKQFTDEAQPGLLDILGLIQPRVDKMSAASLSAQRASDISDVANLGPEATAAFKAANPQQAALLDEINRQALEQLKMGSGLDPDQSRNIEQSVRGAQAARGLGTGRGDATAEAVYKQTQGDQLRQLRQAYATQVAGVNAATTSDPFQTILGRPATQLAQGNNLAGQAANSYTTARPQLFDPNSPYAADLYNTNYNAEAASNISNANNKAAVVGAGVSGAATGIGIGLVAL